MRKYFAIQHRMDSRGVLESNLNYYQILARILAKMIQAMHTCQQTGQKLTKQIFKQIYMD